jgi:type IV pilus assembly protein PilB
VPIPIDKLKIGRTLLAGGPITQERLQAELKSSGKSESVLGRALLQSGFPSEEQLIAPLLQRLRIPKINARNTKIPLETIRLIPEDLARKHRVLAIDKIGDILVVVTPDLAVETSLAEVRKQTGHLATPIQCSPDGFDQIVDDYYKRLAQSGLAAVQPIGAPAASTDAAAGPVNGVLKAIPAGSASEDSFFKRYMSAGPVPGMETLL